jgi:hypothetical protein
VGTPVRGTCDLTLGRASQGALPSGVSGGGRRAAHRGLWADKAPVPPWEWRASEKGRKGEAAVTRSVALPGRLPVSAQRQGACFQGHTARVHCLEPCGF